MENFPFAIKSNVILGRFIVASKDLKEGELILKEIPVLVGPQISGAIICFQCNCASPNGQIERCPECSIALLCSSTCPGTGHPKGECEALKSCGLKHEDFLNNPQIILPVRFILLRNYNQDHWDRLLQMESHVDDRRNSHVWRSHKIFVEQILEKINFLSKRDLEEELVQRVCGILDVNCFELRPPQNSGYFISPTDCLRGLYLQAAMMAHDCIPNTHLAVDDDFNMTIHASCRIAEGETIYYNYANGLQGSFYRRRHLKEGKYFDCACSRCSDASEKGTNLSSLKCPRCKNGLVAPSDPLTNVYTVQWICAECQNKFEGPMIKSAINECKRVINTISPLNALEAEEILNKLLKTLCSQHYLILELKQHIVAIYNELAPSTNNLKRKIELCKEFMPVLRILEPGISRLQAIALYELHAAELSLANKEYNTKEISTQQFLKKLDACEELLKESLKSLLYEPTKSPEGKLSQKAMTELRVLRGTIKDINRILKINNTQEVISKIKNTLK